MGHSWMRWLVLAGGGLLVVAGTVLAVYPPPIRDDGKFFSREALTRANQKIRQIYEKYKKDVVVETLPALSAEQEKKLKEDGKTRFFARLARDRAVELGVNGVYVLILKKPTHLQVHMDPDTQKKGFTAVNRKALIERMIARFREDNFDGGLADALEAIETAFRTNLAVK